MERHAVPQNIMEVEFKLFGAFSVRQFGYLAAGFVIAVIIYFLKWPVLVKLILMFFSAIMGIVLAVLKINGQPSSVFITNYILALFSTQERVWKKTAVTPEALKLEVKSKKQLDDQLILRAQKSKRMMPISALTPQINIEPKVTVEADNYEKQRFQEIDRYFDNSINKVNKLSPSEIRQNVKPPSLKEYSSQNRANMINQNPAPPVVNPSAINLANEQVNNQDSDVVSSTDTYAALVKPTNKVTVNRPINNNSYNDLKNQILNLQEHVSSDEDVSNNITKQTTLPNSSNYGSTILGTVTDKKGNPIDSAEVNILDEEEKFIRKLSTNKNGKFLLTNPLRKGVYFIDIKSSKAKFNRYQIELTGNKENIFNFTSR